MIKKLKLGLMVAVLSVGFMATSAFADPLTFSARTNVTVNSIVEQIQAGSTSTSIVVGSTTLTVTVPSGSTFDLVSPDRFLLTNSLGLGQVCTGSQNSVSVVGASGGTTVVFSPVNTLCTAPTGGGGLVTSVPAGGGGGGSSSTPPPATTTTPTTLTITSTTPTPTTIAGCNGSTGFSTATGQSCSGNTVTVTTTAPVSIPGCNNGTSGFSVTSGGSCAGNTGAMVTVTTSYNFGTVTLRNGSTGSGVMALQNFLNRFLNLGLVVDGKLGPKTIAVIKKWQASKGLVADGLIGPKTKAMMNVQAENGY